MVPSPCSLAVTKVSALAGGLALALQVKLLLSNVPRGDKVRLLVNSGCKPERGEIVTLLVLLDKGVEPFSQLMSISVTDMAVSVAELKEMVHVRVRGAVLPAYSVPLGIVTATSGVETGGREGKKHSLCTGTLIIHVNNFQDLIQIYKDNVVIERTKV